MPPWPTSSSISYRPAIFSPTTSESYPAAKLRKQLSCLSARRTGGGGLGEPGGPPGGGRGARRQLSCLSVKRTGGGGLGDREVPPGGGRGARRQLSCLSVKRTGGGGLGEPGGSPRRWSRCA